MHILCNLLRMALSGTARNLTCRGVLCLLLHPNIVAKDPHLKPSSKDSSPKLHCAPLQQLPKKQDQSSHGGPECKQVADGGLHYLPACESAHSPYIDRAQWLATKRTDKERTSKRPLKGASTATQQQIAASTEHSLKLTHPVEGP